MQTAQTQPILVVDDDAHMRSALTEAIHRLGYSTEVCRDGEDAVAKLNRAKYALVVTDMRMPRMDGLAFLREARRRNGSLPVLVITGFGTVENAVDSMKEGAVDYLMKPFSFEALKRAIDGIMERSHAEKEILTENTEMKKIVTLAASLGQSDITVLIQGESGTGKELLARSIHRLSKRSAGPFIAVNCAAIPDTLLESELFGHEKGAFTGATERKIGKFERAHGGTLLLDEIGEMSLVLQAKLLRVLQEREVDRVGGREPVRVDVRVIATTNRDLGRECREGRFREDLFYRLNVFPLKVPPLRERPEDIVFLANHFRKKYSELSGKQVAGYTDAARTLLGKQPWRGNVRELENAVQRAVFLCAGPQIDAQDILFDDDAPSAESNGRIRDMERELILKTLKEVDGNKTRAAKILGVSVRTIRNKLHEYGQEFPGE
jgi:two-component system response regulator FlrC